MYKVTVYRTDEQKEFTGDTAGYTVMADGTLEISWEAAEEKGNATFAADQWEYVERSEPRD